MRQKCFNALSALVLAWAFAAAASAQTNAAHLAQAPAPDSLAQMAQEAKNEFRPLTEADVAAAKARLQRAAAQIERRLNVTDAENAAAWRRFLRWETLQEQLAAQTPDLEALNEVARPLLADVEGMELPEFAELRNALRAYFNAAYYSTFEQAQPLYEQTLDALAERLRSYAAEPNDADAAEIGLLLARLADMGQAERLIAAVRAPFTRPNLFVDAADRLVAAAIEDDVDEPVQVHECILGTDVYGEGRTKGRLTAGLLPSPDSALIDLQFKGQSFTNNIGFNGPVTIYSRGVTDIKSRNPIRVTDQGFVPLKPEAWANTHTTLDAICARHRLVQQLATRQAYRRLPEAEAVASQRAAERAAERMSERTREAMVEANQRYQERVVARLERRQAFPTSLRYFTTHDILGAVALHANEQRLGAPDDPPPPTGQDLTLRVHESYVRSFAADFLGGREMTDERAAELSRQRTGGEVEEYQIEPERRWDLTFDGDRPVRASFRDQRLQLNVLMAEIVINRGAEVEEALNDVLVTANYNIVAGPEGPQFVRDGEVQVEMGDPQRPAYRATIRRRFDRLFPDTLPLDRLEAEEGRLEKVGPLVLKEASSEGGWLTLGYQMQGR